MTETFTTAFTGTLQAVLQIFIVAFAAGILMRKRIINHTQVQALSAITIRILLPCLIFSNIVGHFDPGRFRIWPLLPMACVVMIGFGMLAAAAVFAGQLPGKKNMIAVISLQNAGYFVLPLGSVLFPEQFQQFQLYVFLYVMGFSPIMWSVGKYLISAQPDDKISIRAIITPPFVVNLIALALVFTHARCLIPPVVLGSVRLIGSATIPLAIFILGAVLGGIPLKRDGHLFDAVRVIFVKFLIIPLATIGVLYFTKLNNSYPLLAAFFVIQAAAPPALSLMIQVKHYGGDEKKLSFVVFASYLFCIIAVPFWLAVWNTICR